MNNEIVLYQANELSCRIDVRVEDETVWLNRNQLAVLFNRDVKTIGKHINNVFSEGNWIKIQLSQILRQFKMKAAGTLKEK
jgi:hypothetical protein